MKYTVVWSAHAEQRLTSLWLTASNRNAITQAANQIDRDLQRIPLSVGESRTTRTRIHFAKPLGVFYRVSEADRRVDVLSVWNFNTHEDNET